MENTTIASVHRFNDKVAVYVGKGETVYITGKEARKLAAALNKCARDIKTIPSFSKSEFTNISITKRA